MTMLPYAFGDIGAFLEDNPTLLYQALRPQSRSRSFADFFRDRQPQIEQDYLGNMTRDLLSGGTGNQTFQDFLRNYNFRADYLSRSPRARGMDFSQFAPRLRFNLG